jgi:hypothetical protein
MTKKEWEIVFSLFVLSSSISIICFLEAVRETFPSLLFFKIAANPWSVYKKVKYVKTRINLYDGMPNITSITRKMHQRPWNSLKSL